MVISREIFVSSHVMRTGRAEEVLNSGGLQEPRELLSNVHLLEKALTMLIGDSVRDFGRRGA